MCVAFTLLTCWKSCVWNKICTFIIVLRISFFEGPVFVSSLTANLANGFRKTTAQRVQWLNVQTSTVHLAYLPMLQLQRLTTTLQKQTLSPRAAMTERVTSANVTHRCMWFMLRMTHQSVELYLCCPAEEMRTSSMTLKASNAENIRQKTAVNCQNIIKPYLSSVWLWRWVSLKPNLKFAFAILDGDVALSSVILSQRLRRLASLKPNLKFEFAILGGDSFCID